MNKSHSNSSNKEEGSHFKSAGLDEFKHVIKAPRFEKTVHHINSEERSLNYDAFLQNIMVDAYQFWQINHKKATHLVIPLNKRLKGD